MINKLYSVYIVECNDKTFYTGITNNVNKRIIEHNNSNRGAKYTKTRRPVSLKYMILCNSKSEALKLEYKIKRLSHKDKEKLWML